ncbi:MAG: response regulator [candidate division Zixibacteria bacterium CG_4_9_14_3_um_filter_46_8]|nr:MAG: response regulator [candidate division Zixibacteria bacterium CG_4_9_14_3_um_filter_46_8]
MKILIAEDDVVSRKLLKAILSKWDHEVIVAKDGNEALEALMQDDAPCLAILDWMMPGKDGIDVCREVRQQKEKTYLYIIMLTAKQNKGDIVKGLDAGADDYIAKPFDMAELKARINVGQRIVNLELSLQTKVVELQKALDNIKQLRGIIPICAWCKKIRDDKNYWQNVETYVASNSNADFSHLICPECSEKYFGELMKEEQVGS